jgi:hypothetical protein
MRCRLLPAAHRVGRREVVGRELDEATAAFSARLAGGVPQITPVTPASWIAHSDRELCAREPESIGHRRERLDLRQGASDDRGREHVAVQTLHCGTSAFPLRQSSAGKHAFVNIITSSRLATALRPSRSERCGP